MGTKGPLLGGAWAARLARRERHLRAGPLAQAPIHGRQEGAELAASIRIQGGGEEGRLEPRIGALEFLDLALPVGIGQVLLRLRAAVAVAWLRRGPASFSSDFRDSFI